MTRDRFESDLKALGLVLDAVGDLKRERQQWVLDTAASRLGLGAVAGKASDPSSAARAVGGQAEQRVVSVGASADASGKTPKQFLRLKSPRTDVQRIACLAYFLTHERRQPHFKTKDLTALNTEAAGSKIGNPSQAVNNATIQNHYLAAAGKGNKQITALGEDIVEALPSQEQVAEADKQHRPKRKTGGKRKTSGKK